jgi:glycosyltransferase involved in cell wall biosynthesis
MNQGRPGTFSIVIPAFNEEEAIAATITRCLAAREQIKAAAQLSHVEVIVVSDGSTDRTAEIAGGFRDVKLITFAKNRGYGAAIKEGFRQSSGMLVGFLDADGTCDPLHFAPMCRIALEKSADVVLGSRLGPDSKMPLVRRIGNRFFAVLLGLLCGRQVTDTASGMRVIRRQSLALLYPLPDRMHFTPAMSARALVNNLCIVEVPMPYAERVGRSKLHVLGDGVRFLRTIISAVLCFQPERLFLLAFAVCLVLGSLLAAYPLEYYLRHQHLQEWMIYRCVVAFLLGACGVLLLSGTALAHQMAHFSPRRSEGGSYWPPIIQALFSGKPLAACLGVILAVAGYVLWPGVHEYVSSGRVSLHWSRLLVGAFGLLLAAQAVITSVLLHVIALWKMELTEQRRSHDEDRLHVPASAEIGHEARAA